MKVVRENGKYNGLFSGKNTHSTFSFLSIPCRKFLASFVVLWLNEGNNVAQLKKADYMGKNAVEISAQNIDRANDNKLVQVSGKAETTETLTDKIITVPNTFALSRKVEMYQWEENVKTEKNDNMGGSTTETKTYTYEKVWSDHEINSDNFKKTSYSNPKFTIKSEDVYAQTGKLGEFNLTTKQTEEMHGYTTFENLPISGNTGDVYNVISGNGQVGDIDYVYGKCLATNTRTSKIHRQTTYLVNRGIKDYLKMKEE